jgi:hypothetical protein
MHIVVIVHLAAAAVEAGGYRSPVRNEQDAGQIAGIVSR